MRIAVKRLRYACDFFAGSFPYQAVQPFLARLAALQDTLGELNDAAVARKLLDALGPPGESAARVRQWSRSVWATPSAIKSQPNPLTGATR